MDYPILKGLLKQDSFEQNKELLSPALFEGDNKELYEVIVNAHEKFSDDVLPSQLFDLWVAEHPVATRSDKDAIKEVCKEIAKSEEYSDTVLSYFIHKLWTRLQGITIANYGVRISEGDDRAFNELLTYIERNKDGVSPDDFGEETTKDLNEIFEMFSSKGRFRFPIATLARQVPGIGRTEFAIIFATPETGKTLFTITLACAPGGFCDQGKNVLYLGNEEDTKKTMARAHAAYLGWPLKRVEENKEQASELFAKIADRITMKDIQEWDLQKVEAYIAHKKPDVVIIDQGDKVNVAGKFNASHEKLRELYRQFREIAKRNNCALIVVSQASNDAANRTKILPTQMEGSKIGKFAECDLIIGIGKGEDLDDPTRYLTLGKNKLTGYHGTIVCQIDSTGSRYVE